ncbi:hypothetical protein ACEQPO_26110 [Bacillus sp. SL00103]
MKKKADDGWNERLLDFNVAIYSRNENRAFAYEDLDQKRQQIEEKTSKTESTLQKKKKSSLAKLEKKERIKSSKKKLKRLTTK